MVSAAGGLVIRQGLKLGLPWAMGAHSADSRHGLHPCHHGHSSRISPQINYLHQSPCLRVYVWRILQTKTTGEYRSPKRQIICCGLRCLRLGEQGLEPWTSCVLSPYSSLCTVLRGRWVGQTPDLTARVVLGGGVY